MPIYEYTCPSCGHDFEKILRINAPSPPCPSCQGVDVRKKMSLSAFHLKGGGWFSDAYAGKDNKAAEAASPDKAGPAKAEGTPAATTESKSTEAKSPAPSKSKSKSKSTDGGSANSS